MAEFLDKAGLQDYTTKLSAKIKTIPGVADTVVYLTEAPTSANTDGLKFVVLSSDPATKYDGYIYIITGGQNDA